MRFLQRRPSSSSQLGWSWLSLAAGCRLRERSGRPAAGGRFGPERGRAGVGWKGVLVGKGFLDMARDAIWIPHRTAAVSPEGVTEGWIGLDGLDRR